MTDQNVKFHDYQCSDHEHDGIFLIPFTPTVPPLLLKLLKCPWCGKRDNVTYRGTRTYTSKCPLRG